MIDPRPLASDDRIGQLSPEQLELLLRQFQGQVVEDPDRIRPRQRSSGGAPLSFAQERLWFLDQLRPGSPAYNVPVAFQLSGPLDAAALAASLEGIVRRHEVLRTTFVAMDGNAVQVVAPAARCDLSFTDLSMLAPAERTRELAGIQAEEASRPFDLERGPLLRAALLRLATEEHVLLLNLHHIVADAWSLGILLREIAALYQGAQGAQGPQESPLPELPVQYADYAVWQRGWLQGERLASQLAYWKHQLADLQPLALPTDRPRPAVQSWQGRRRPVALPAVPLSAVKTLGDREGGTLFITLLAAFETLLHRYTGEEDVAVGSAVANRNRPEVEGLIGFFVNTLVMRGRVSGRATGRELLRATREVALAAFAHQDLPFERLVDELKPERTLSHNPLVQLVLGLQNAPLALELPGTGLAVSVLDTDNGTSKLDLYLLLWEEEGRLAGNVEYSTDLFDDATVLRLVRHLESLLAGLTAAPDRPVGDLPLLTLPERQQLLAEWNDTREPGLSPDNLCLHELIAAQAERTPDEVAVVFAGENLTYRELQARAGRLARHLVRLGAGPEVRVGIAAERSLELVVGLLAVLQAGGAYVPLDPSYPRERLAFMIEDSLPAVLLTQERLAASLPAGDAPVLFLDRDAGEAADTAPVRLSAVAPDNLAYVIYTSGSTGRPKGAMNTHRAIVNRLLWMQRAYGLGGADRVLQKTPMSFDVSVWEFFWPLLAGARLVIARPGGHQDASYLARTIAEEGVTTLHFVPSMLQVFLEEPDLGRLPSLRRVVASGEALSPAHQERFFARLGNETGAGLHNLYGPTEAAVDVTVWACTPGGKRTVPIGRPIGNLAIHLLDRELRPVPVGVPGQLHIGGVGLARGYLGRPDLTAERFIPSPLSGEPGARLYATGDLARHLPDGAIEYLGRLDHQHKLRGFRIELEEIEAVLREHPAVSEAVAAVREDRPGDPRLVAYAVPDASRAGALRNLLRLEREGRLADLSRWELPNGMAIVQRNRAETEFVYREIFEDESYLRGGVTLDAGDCVVDAGANIGLFTLFAGTRAPGVTLYAIEPIPALFELLRLNAEIHGLAVRALDCGLGEEATTAAFTYYPHNSIVSGRYADGAAEREVVRSFELGRRPEASAAAVDEVLAARMVGETVVCPIKPLSQVFREEGIERVDLLKIDVEKSERDVLAGIANEDWPKIRQVVAEVHDVDDRLAWVEGLLTARGFTVTIEQESALGQTGLSTVYAVRPEARRAPSALAALAAAQRWSGPSRLTSELRQALTERLPEFMIPSVLLLLDALPLSPNGKVDRRSLPAPMTAAEPASGARPGTPVEEMLASLWRELLGSEDVRLGDNFFDLGGHSLKATQLRSRVHAAFGLDLPLQSFFTAQTLALQASLVEGALRQGVAAAPPITPTPRDGELPLSFAQQRLWFLDQLEPGTPLYNIPLVGDLRGVLDVAALERSFGEIVRRHESLRTTFPETAAGAVQKIAPPGKAHMPLPVVDVSGLPPVVREREHERLTLAAARRPFDLARGPLMRTLLLRAAEREHVLVISMHHIISDGWSTGVIVRELSTFYRGFTAGLPASPPAPPLQYADFALWQRRWLTGEVFDKQMDYWRHQLAGLSVVELPTDRPRPAVETFRGALLPAALPPALTGPMRELARGTGATLYMFLLAAFDALVASYTGRTDVAVGAAVANRNRRETEDVIGFFVNTLVMRTRLSGDPSMRELLSRVRETALAAYVHEDMPFERIVEELQPQRDLSRNPLFQVMLVLQNAPLPPLDLPGLTVSPRQLDLGTVKFDMAMVWWEEEGRLVGQIEHSTVLFDATTVRRLLGHYEALLARAIANPDLPISALAGPTEAERHQIVEEWNDSRIDFGPGRCIHQWMEEQVAATPEALALVAGDIRLNYRELNAMANRLAHHLRRLGIGPDVLVGICVDRTWALVIGLLGVLKAGGAALALDPTYPEERLRYVIEDAGLALLLAEEKLLPLLPDTGIPRLRIDTDWPLIAAESDADPACRTDPDSTMYLIYTSGSTGLPKGVSFPHRAFVNLLDWQFGHSRLARRARTVQFATFGFCVSFLEIFAVLCSGSTLVMVPEEYRRDMEALWKHLEEHEIERLHLPFAALKQLADVCGEEDRVPRHLREVVTSGEQLQIGRSIRSLFSNLQGCSLTNQYGTSEIHVVSSFPLPTGPADWPDISPVGRPVANSQIYLLDAQMQLLPVGVLGELHAGGACLARGYLGAPAQTAAKFVPDPFAARRGEPGARLYRTGDLARQLPDGRVEWFGRIDNQVRIRGFRVELGEVETAVKQHLQVRNAAVLCRPGPGGAPRLIAYVVPHEGDAVPDDLRPFLKAKLPEHMVPALFVPMANLPLNANGKLDFEAFPDPGQEDCETSFVAPTGPVEEMVAQILAKVLNAPRIGAHESFFALGGHSLLATQVANRIRRNFAIDLPLRTFFEGPTVAELARAVVALEARPGKSEKIARAFLKVSNLSGLELQQQLLASRAGGMTAAPAQENARGPAPAQASRAEPVVDLSDGEHEQMRRLWEGVPLDPYADFERFVLESRLIFHQMPERIRRALVEFGHKSNLDSVLLLRGLPQDPVLPPTPTRADEGVRKATFASELWLCAVASAFGEPVGYLQEKQGSILQDLFPTPANAGKQSSESSAVLLAFHTEAAFHPFMPDYVLLHGLRQDPHKEARTMFASVRRFLHLLSPADKETLFANVFRTGIDYSFGNTTGERGTGPLVPVLYGDRQDPFMRYDLDLMVGQTPAACRALEVVRDLVNEVKQEVAIEPGSLLVIDNRRCVHARSVFRAAFDGRDRWLQRTAVVRDLDASVEHRLHGTRIIATDFSSYLGTASAERAAVASPPNQDWV